MRATSYSRIRLNWTKGIGLPDSLDLKEKTKLEPRTRYMIQDPDKIWIKGRTKYGVYSCPSLPFLRIKNKEKIKRHVFCSRIWILEKKH